MKGKGLLGVELFSGAGGMSLGAIQAGVKTEFAVEVDYYAATTFASNIKNATVVIDDIRNIKEFKLRKKTPTILFGGPPCQGFSSSNQKTRSVDNPRNWLFKEFMRCAKLIMPDWIVMENVRGFVEMQKAYFLNKVFRDLNKLGYTTNCKVLNAADFGVPQKRERIFIVASLHGIAFSFPAPMIHDRMAVKDAIFDLPDLANGDIIYKKDYKCLPNSDYSKKMRGYKKKSINNYVTKNSELVIKRYKHIPQGGNWSNIPLRLMKNYEDHTRCHHGIYRRLSENEPSVVIGNYRKNMLIHPTQDRGLSVREAARLQSFPDWFEFHGPLISQQQQVGDAVPPLLAKAIFKNIIEQS
jgi:DNA (cytosine-5)-methyltransferase 1